MVAVLTEFKPQAVRTDQFSTALYREAHQFSYWRRVCAPIGDTRRDASGKSAFSATAEGFDLGPLHMATVKTDRFAYERTIHAIRAASLDHWLLSLRHTGVESSRSGDRVLQERAGTLSLKSLAFPMAGECENNGSTHIFIRRDYLPHLAHQMDQARHTELTGSLADILKNMIGAMTTYLPTLTTGEVPAVAASISALLEATLNSTANVEDDANGVIAASLFDRAQRYIRANLTRRELCVEDICSALSISRRQLYYLFKQHGGVAKFIRLQRLAASHAALVTASDHRRISSIAYDFGFTNPTEFGRQFRLLYGYSPSEATEARIYVDAPPMVPPRTLTEWLMQVRNLQGASTSST